MTAFEPSDYGLFNMVGNVWEWVAGLPPQPPGSPQKDQRPQRILRGGSFIDSADGKLNHAVRVSSRQLNSEDSAGSNVGFRCCCGSEQSAISAADAKKRAYRASGGPKEGGVKGTEGQGEDEEQPQQRRRRTVWEEQDEDELEL